MNTPSDLRPGCLAIRHLGFMLDTGRALRLLSHCGRTLRVAMEKKSLKYSSTLSIPALFILDRIAKISSHSFLTKDKMSKRDLIHKPWTGQKPNLVTIRFGETV
jgi:hypothetical protein